MSKCYVNLEGGLGNQIFQIANGFAYSKKYDKELCVSTKGWAAHQGNHPFLYKDSIFSKFNFENAPDGIETLNEDPSRTPLKNVEGDVLLYGYFQGLEYFYDCKDNFISLLTLPEPNLSFLQPKNVAFHIRRGDYLVFRDVHLICGTEYFTNEFERFKDYQINVFTDSPDMVSNEFDGYDFNIIRSNSGCPELSEMIMMSRHDNFVGSNSSLSWWASLLGNKKEQVIFPRKWVKSVWDLNDKIYFLRGDMTLSDNIL